MSIKLARPVQPRLWRHLALASAGVTLAAMPTLSHGQSAALTQAEKMGATLWLAQAEGGEAGESGSVESGDETVDFLAGLLQIEGHLNTGFALWAEGDLLNGQAHMGHPLAEVYEGIEHELEELGQPKFEAGLEALVDAAVEGKAQTELDAIRATVLAGIDAAREVAVSKDPRDDFIALVHLIRKAGDEWAEGVQNGDIAELHEYQDAWGFVRAARDRASQLATSADPAVAAAATATLAALDELSPALPAVTPAGAIGGDATLFAAAAAKIELAAFKVK